MSITQHCDGCRKTTTHDYMTDGSWLCSRCNKRHIAFHLSDQPAGGTRGMSNWKPIIDQLAEIRDDLAAFGTRLRRLEARVKEQDQELSALRAPSPLRTDPSPAMGTEERREP